MDSALLARLRVEFGWAVEGEWSDEALLIINETGKDITAHIERLKGMPAPGWVRRNIPAVFRRTGLMGKLKFLRGNSFVFPRVVVCLADQFERIGAGAKAHVAHELGHVLDNHAGNPLLPATFVGGGAADQMVRAVGGAPQRSALRFAPDRNYPRRAGLVETWKPNHYGNNSPADDFAETFSLTIYQPDTVPPQRLLWMTEFLRSLP